MQVKSKDNDQRENIFHTRCFFNSKVNNIIIDKGSCTNVASILLMDRLGLGYIKHLNPYKLHLLNESGEIKVIKQVKIPFSINKYANGVLYDFVPMQAGHILIRRTWQYDRKVNHVSGENQYSLHMNSLTHVLTPFSWKEFYEDQIKIKWSFDGFFNNWEISPKTKKNGCFHIRKDSSINWYAPNYFYPFLYSLFLRESNDDDEAY